MNAAAQQRLAQSSPFAHVLASSRPLSCVNTAYPFAVAYLLAGGRVDLAWVVGTLWCLVPYNLLMYGVNDVFDYESDIRNPRKGGAEGVVLDRALHRATLWSVVVSNLPFVVALVLLGDLRSTLVLAVSVFALVAYSAPELRFKERPFLDSLTSSTHFVSPAVLGIALAGGTFDPVILAALAGFFAWGVGSHAFGAVQDIEADRAGGIASIGTVLGARRTTGFALLAYLVSGLLLLALPWPSTLAAALVLPYLANVVPYQRLEDAECERARRLATLPLAQLSHRLPAHPADHRRDDRPARSLTSRRARSMRSRHRSHGGCTCQLSSRVRTARAKRRRTCAAPRSDRAETPTCRPRASRTLRPGPRTKARSMSSCTSGSSRCTSWRTASQVLRRTAMLEPHSAVWPSARWLRT